jgi:hypothetical protein
MEKYTPNSVQEIHKCSEQIVALQSVNKFFPESYDFAAKKSSTLKIKLKG